MMEGARRFGKINVLYNNAGVALDGDASVTTMTEDIWARTLSINTTGIGLCCKHGIPELLKAGGGSIINIASFVALVGCTNPEDAYTASKGAVTLMTKAMALDHAHEQIRVNAICPGIVDTELVAQFINNAPDPEAARKQRIALHPLGRFGQPEDIAHTAIYLASDESAWVTGTAIPIDGGYSAV